MAIWQTVRHDITYPSDVIPESNGLLRPDQLRLSMAPGYGMFALHPLASRAFNVLQFNCWHETGQQLTLTSMADGYRNLQRQTAAFLQRMTTEYNPLSCTTITRSWQGKTWWLKKGYAQVAVPGKSNHGWGLAFDAALWVEVKGAWKVVSVGSNPWLMGWLEQNVLEHGFAWNNRTESWHLEFWPGDNMPQRVLDLEHLFNVVI